MSDKEGTPIVDRSLTILRQQRRLENLTNLPPSVYTLKYTSFFNCRDKRRLNDARAENIYYVTTINIIKCKNKIKQVYIIIYI